MSRQMPYQPMGARKPPAGDVEVAAMFKKLAAHAKTEVEVQTETQSPKAKVGLEWKDPVSTGSRGTAFRETVCGRFTISKDAHELGYSYTAWRREEKFPPTHLGCVKTADEAMKLCEAAR